VHSLCMGVGVRTALLVFTQIGSVTEGFKLCWRTGQKLTLKPSFDHPDTIQPLSVQSTFSLQKATLINSQLSTFPVLFFFISITYRSSFLPKMYNVTF